MRAGLVALGPGLALLLAACQPGAVRQGTDEHVPTLPAAASVPAPEPQSAEPAPAAGDRDDAKPGEAADDAARIAARPFEEGAIAPGEPERLRTGGQVFERLASGFQAPACIEGEHNLAWRRRYAGDPGRFAAQLEQILPLLAFVTEETGKRGLPAEFALIPIVESWYRPGAIGPGGPAGLWQMMPATARHHGILITSGYDGRLNPAESTDAALAYLQTLSRRFAGDWRAVAMAYNAGEYRILRAFRASGDHRASGEERLPVGLARTTYDYVAKLRALACLIAEPHAHGLALPVDSRFSPLVRVELPASVRGPDQAAHWLGVDAASLRALHPAFRRGQASHPTAGRVLLVPETPLVRQRLAAGAPDPATLPPAPPPRQHEIRPGDTLSGIAARYGVPLKQLYLLNGLDGRSILRPGRRLRIDP
ncbi:transglycosylase SLT domain-containing protein [Arenimonas fontis]|uniref:Transglycosylase SLT domain-containing protein n=1 Tax=Arenimonas fontis TaxID=2608255 RepID=A0A5B2ZCE6_9GAMM|nr:transglycosylase SLT domain-containing protein [Arenimonas fontis]KAA2285657.1 transglycosylase SLT domain-containing protein [Arenimonas fontis]